VVWWLARHENEIEKAVNMIGPLAQISAAANDEEVPELFRHLLVPPVGSRNGATVGGAPWGGDGQEEETFNREEEVGVSDRLRLLLSAVGLKPDMDEYTVLVHRVTRTLEAAGLDEAANEIRRSFLPTPDENEDEGPESRPSAEEDAKESWPPGFPDPEDSPFSDANAADPDTDAGASTSTPGAAGSGAGEQDRGQRETREDNMTPPYFWETPHRPHRPAAPRAWDKGDEESS
jgi:hypothetical protein